jgi:hypothetical protein
MPAFVARFHMTSQRRHATTRQFPQYTLLPGRRHLAIGVQIRGTVTSNHVGHFQQGSDHDPPPSSGADGDGFGPGDAGAAAEGTLAGVVFDSSRSSGLHVVQVELYNALEAIRVTGAKLKDVIGNFHEGKKKREHLDVNDCQQALYTCRFWGSIFQDLVGGVLPSVRDSAFKAIREYENENTRNVSHMEGAILGLAISRRSLGKAMDLSAELDDIDIEDDEIYQLLFVAHGSMTMFENLFESVTVFLHREQTLDELLAGVAPRPYAERHAAWMAENFPDGFPPLIDEDIEAVA